MVETVYLEATQDSDLVWKEVASDREIFWELDLGLRAPGINLHDPPLLASNRRALEVFAETQLVPHLMRTAGVCLYRGPLQYNAILRWNAAHEEYSSGRGDRTLYALEVLSEYLHLLGSLLPEEVPLFALFDETPHLSPARRGLLLSKEHFSYIQTERDPPEVTVGVVLPLIENASREVLGEIDDYISGLDGPYRLIYESHLTEMWDELDEIVVHGPSLSKQGEWKLKGFLAAGGDVKEIRGRGI